MLRYVILTHDLPSLHWDFLAEDGEVLQAWRLLAEPRPGEIIPAELNSPHRRFYLDYEGPVSGGRGNVARWDSGTCEWLVNDPDRAVLALCGTRLIGSVELTWLRRGNAWQFTFKAAAEQLSAPPEHH